MIDILKNIFKVFLIVVCAVSITGCRDEDLSEEIGSESQMPVYEDAFALNFMVTLDNMGTRAAYDHNYDPYEVTRRENYIDLERFRVLFFDTNDMFLFESKNRWVRQVEAGDSFSSWYVSVPLGAFGNDSYGQGMEYDWDNIKEYLTKYPFKIAILANRPARLLYPGFNESELELPDGVFDNDGPYWGPGDAGKKSIFDLHHYQYDIIYADKGKHGDGAEASYYDFVMGEINTTRPTMGSAINWVDFDAAPENVGSSTARNALLPGEDHPIPMYGIQQFEPIPPKAWKKGTPFDISNEPADAFPDNSDYSRFYRSIALLRCCVRLDLLIPKSVKNGAPPKFLTLWYSNIYSRTEPMDTWTPTDQIWNTNGRYHDDKNCEMQSIINYGPVSYATSGYYGTTKNDYQKRMSWFYGIWGQKGWQFQTRTSNVKITPVAQGANTPYPHIFNTCIQRNKVIRFNNNDMSRYYNDNYWHFIVYTGERNINDPNTLPQMNKNPYIACFVISWDNSKFYAIPLLNYTNNSDPDLTGVFGPHTDSPYDSGSWPTKLNTYMNTLPTETNSANWPYPLLRNHIYRFTLSNTTKAVDSEDDLSPMGISSEVLSSRDINFSPVVQKANLSSVKKDIQYTSTTAGNKLK